jgi:hypothetical protein
MKKKVNSRKLDKIKGLNKESQVTIFIIISTIIVAIIVLFVFLYVKNPKPDNNTIQSEIEPIYSYAIECAKQTGKNAILSTSIHGGYVNASYATPGGTAYFYDNGRYFMPSIDDIQNQLDSYVNQNIKNCDFSRFGDFQIDKASATTKATISENKVTYDIVFPLSIKKGTKDYSLKNFKDIEISVRLGTIHSAISNYFNQAKAREGEICMSCLYDIARSNNLSFELYDYNNDTILFIVRDKMVKIDNESFQFNFANKYPLQDHLMDSIKETVQ